MKMRDLERGLETYNEAVRARIRDLPEAPPTCTECGCDTWKLYEYGYSRFTDIEHFPDGVWVATTDGWDDMSESGSYEVLLCWHCEAVYRPPEEVEWT